MPSSGARSGTQPSRSERGAGDGRVGGLLLTCGHETHDREPVAVYAGGRKIWRCPKGCGLLERRHR